MGPTYGTQDHYGHFDILMGRRVETEVFPLLTDWLNEQDANEYDREAVVVQPGSVALLTELRAGAAAAAGQQVPVATPPIRSKL